MAELRRHAVSVRTPVGTLRHDKILLELPPLAARCLPAQARLIDSAACEPGATDALDRHCRLRARTVGRETGESRLVGGDVVRRALAFGMTVTTLLRTSDGRKNGTPLVTYRHDVVVVTHDELVGVVEMTFLLTARGLSAWPDPHSGRVVRFCLVFGRSTAGVRGRSAPAGRHCRASARGEGGSPKAGVRGRPPPQGVSADHLRSCRGPALAR